MPVLQLVKISNAFGQHLQGDCFEKPPLSLMACHNLSHFNSRVVILDFTWNCCRLRKAKTFSRNPGQFKCVTRKAKYHLPIGELLKRNLSSQVAELVQRLRTMLKILYFSGGHQILQISQAIKSLCGRGRILIHLLPGEA